MKPLALQLYSLRREFNTDAEATLRLVPSLGYDSVELAGTYDWSADKWKKLLSETGLRVVSAHTSVAALETEWTQTLEFHRAIGCTSLIISYTPPEFRHVPGYKYIASRLNVLGKRARSEGVALGYHNHAFEFDKLEDGSTGFDLLMAETDPAAVAFEVDTYWVERGGRNSLSEIEKHAAQIGWLHAKELRKRDNADVPAGEGDIDFKSIIPLAKKNNWPVIVEYEGEGAVESVKQSAAYFQKL